MEAASAMQVIQDFFASNNLKLETINLKLNNRGRVKYCTGTFGPLSTLGEVRPVVKQFNKKLVAGDYRFSNSALTITSKQFVIIDRNEDRTIE